MTTNRDLMKESNQNLSWCKPVEFEFENKTVILAINEGEIVGVNFNGKDHNNYSLSDIIEHFGITEEINNLSDLYYADNLISNDLPCWKCPWFDTCEAMDGDAEE